MKKQIKEVFDEFFKHIEFDKEFYKKIFKYRTDWVYKNNEHMEFLGSNLLGVNEIKFSALDEETLYLDILNVNVHDIRVQVHALKDIYPERHVSSNVTYLILTYLMHRFTISKSIGKLRDDAVREVYFITAYKMIGSIYSRYFPYMVDKTIATAVYEQLNNKFLIKRFGTWSKVFEHRAEDLLQPKGLHAKRILQYKLTDDVTRVVIDMQGRIRDMVKNIYVVLQDVKENNSKVKSTSLNETDIEGEEAVKSIIDRPDMYINYIKSIMFKHNDFIKDDIMYVITDLLEMNLNKDLYNTLTYMSENYMVKTEMMDKVISGSLNLSIAYLSKVDNAVGYTDNLNSVIVDLKNYFTGSRVYNKDLEDLKGLLKKIFKEATGRSNKTKLSNVRVAVILYIFLRAIVKNTYD